MANIVREYRKGPTYRSGNIAEDKVKKEFKFLNINYGTEYSGKEKQDYLNYTYDALKDFADILNVPTDLFSLKTKEGVKADLTFGSSNKSYKNFVVTKEGNVVRSWYHFLDKYLGNEYSLDTGLANNINVNFNDEIGIATKELLRTLKTKEGTPMSVVNEELTEVQRNLDELLDSLPVKDNTELEKIIEIEDAREKFINELSTDSLNAMFEVYEKYKVALGPLKNKIIKEFANAVKYSRKSNSTLSNDLVDTDYYASAKKLDGNKKFYSTNLELLSYAISLYIDNKLRQQGNYNNFLTLPKKNEDLSFTAQESFIFFEAIEKYLSVILDYVVDKVCIEEDIEIPEAPEVMEQRTENIEKELEDDKGKFKLTYFKELAVKEGLKIDRNRTEKSVSSCYYLNFDDSYIKYIRVAVYNHPKDKNHCINIYQGDNGDTKTGYWWDGPLDYVALVKHLKEIELKGADANFEKFKLTSFKEACKANKLSVDTSETPIENGKYRIGFINTFLKDIVVDVKMNTEETKEKELIIHTINSEIKHSWRGPLDYNILIRKLIHINKTGIEEIETQKAKVETERNKLIQQYKDTKAEMLRDKKDNGKSRSRRTLDTIIKETTFESTKDLRDLMQKYVNMRKYPTVRPLTPPNVVNVLYEKTSNIDGVPFEVQFNTIPEKKITGNAKNWCLVDDNHLVVLSRSQYNKQLEGIIEGFVHSKMKRKNYNKSQKEMLTETLVFMLCRTLNLDVRTYCMNNNFERLCKSQPENISSFMKTAFNLYDKIANYIG